MKNIDWNSVPEAQGTDRKQVVPGGYVAAISTAVDYDRDEYIIVCVDIIEGEYRGIFTEQEKRFHEWPMQGQKRLYYREKSQPFFKSFLRAVEKSNKGYTFTSDEKSLARKKVGVIFGIEQYWSRDGELKESVRIQRFVPVDDIKSGSFTIPEPRKPYGEPPRISKANGFNELPVNEAPDDLPF